MGTTREETRLPELRDRTTVSVRNKVIYYPSLILISIVSFALGSNVYKESIINDTLKLCNQKQLECKFKYDMVMYQETGKIPYTEVKPPEKDKK